MLQTLYKWTILPKTNIAPENRPSQKESSLPTTNFQINRTGKQDCKLQTFSTWNPRWPSPWPTNLEATNQETVAIANRFHISRAMPGSKTTGKYSPNPSMYSTCYVWSTSGNIGCFGCKDHLKKFTFSSFLPFNNIQLQKRSPKRTCFSFL